MSKEVLRKGLQDSIMEFCESNDWEKDKIEDIVEDSESFYNYIEEHDDLKEKMYEFFRNLFDEYDSYRFYNNPIPALIYDNDYMERRKKEIKDEADNFFNFGGIKTDK